jgi:hypothetical protein
VEKAVKAAQVQIKEVTMEQNKILRFMEDIIYFRLNEDKEGMAALMAEGEEEHVTLKDVASATVAIVDDITSYIDAVQGLDEVRLLAVIESLPEDVQAKIAAKFEEAEDDLLKTKTEGENN